MMTELSPAAVGLAEKPLVLVVDDEYGPRESIAFTLASEFTVETAARAAEALGKLKEKPFAAVVLDIRMPEMDGIKALEHLRKIDADVSVIMLTGYGTLLTAQQAMEAGANQYLRKPPDVNELLQAVRKQAAATRLRRRQTQMNRENQALNTALKREIEQAEPHIWQSRASVELVHDLNNPLTVVIGYASLLGEEARAVAAHDAARGQKLKDYSNIVEKAAEYCHHLAENWRQSARKSTDFGLVDIVDVAREVQQVIFFGNTDIRFSGLAEATVRGAKFELMRVLQNLFKNALESGATKLTLNVVRAGEQFEVTVQDNGPGMTAEAIKRALHGGFTSKDSGTGLGLSICRHLLGRHGATLSIEATVGQGTTIKLVFPAAKA